VETVSESVTVIIANKQSYQDSWKREKLEAMCLMLKGALDAKSKVLLKFNVAQANLEQALGTLPSLHSPTVNHLAESDWAAVETVADEPRVRELIPALKAVGAEGIIEIALNKMIP